MFDHVLPCTIKRAQFTRLAITLADPGGLKGLSPLKIGGERGFPENRREVGDGEGETALTIRYASISI